MKVKLLAQGLIPEFLLWTLVWSPGSFLKEKHRALWEKMITMFMLEGRHSLNASLRKSHELELGKRVRRNEDGSDQHNQVPKGGQSVAQSKRLCGWYIMMKWYKIREKRYMQLRSYRAQQIRSRGFWFLFTPLKEVIYWPFTYIS